MLELIGRHALAHILAAVLLLLAYGLGLRVDVLATVPPVAYLMSCGLLLAGLAVAWGLVMGAFAFALHQWGRSDA